MGVRKELGYQLPSNKEINFEKYLKNSKKQKN